MQALPVATLRQTEDVSEHLLAYLSPLRLGAREPDRRLYLGRSA